MALSHDEQQLAAFLQMPAAVVGRARAVADRPLRGILYDYSVWDERRRATKHRAPLLCVPCPLSDAYRRVLHLQAQLQPLGYIAFIIAASKEDYVGGTTFQGNTIRARGENRCYIAIYEGDDPYYILRMQSTHFDGGVGPEDIADILKRWSQGCQLTIVGANTKWFLLYLHTLPEDLLPMTREATDLSVFFAETYLNKLIAEGRLPEDVEPDDDDEEAEDALISERAAEEIRKSRVMCLSYY